MKFAVVGGDLRSVMLAESLAASGEKVSCYGLDHSRLSAELKAGCLPACLYGADCVILPVPAARDGIVNTPLGDGKLTVSELMSSLWAGQLICGGKFDDEARELGARQEVHIRDVLKDPDFAAGNGALTAEAALAQIITGTESALGGSRILICGWGRTAKPLALKLHCLGAAVTAAARNARARAEIQALGMESEDFDAVDYGSFDCIVNTVPARVIGDSRLCQIREDTLLLELASPPGGFDMHLARNIGLKALAAPGLPGRISPRSAAELMRRAVFRAIENGEE